MANPFPYQRLPNVFDASALMTAEGINDCPQISGKEVRAGALLTVVFKVKLWSK